MACERTKYALKIITVLRQCIMTLYDVSRCATLPYLSINDDHCNVCMDQHNTGDLRVHGGSTSYLCYKVQ